MRLIRVMGSLVYQDLHVSQEFKAWSLNSKFMYYSSPLHAFLYRHFLLCVQITVYHPTYVAWQQTTVKLSKRLCRTHANVIYVMVYITIQSIPMLTVFTPFIWVDFPLHRFLTAPLWRCLLAACRLLPAPTPNQDSPEGIPIAVPDVPCSDLTPSLQDIITSFLETPHSRPLLLVHNNKSFLSMLNRSVIVDEFKDACKVCPLRQCTPVES